MWMQNCLLCTKLCLPKMRISHHIQLNWAKDNAKTIKISFNLVKSELLRVLNRSPPPPIHQRKTERITYASKSVTENEASQEMCTWVCKHTAYACTIQILCYIACHKIHSFSYSCRKFPRYNKTRAFMYSRTTSLRKHFQVKIIKNDMGRKW